MRFFFVCSLNAWARQLCFCHFWLLVRNCSVSHSSPLPFLDVIFCWRLTRVTSKPSYLVHQIRCKFFVRWFHRLQRFAHHVHTYPTYIFKIKMWSTEQGEKMIMNVICSRTEHTNEKNSIRKNQFFVSRSSTSSRRWQCLPVCVCADVDVDVYVYARVLFTHNGMVAGCGDGDGAVSLFLMGASDAESYSTIRVFLSFTRFCWFDVIILEQCVRIILFRESFMLRSIVCLKAHGVTPCATSIPLRLNVKCNARTEDVCFSKCGCESSTVHYTLYANEKHFRVASVWVSSMRHNRWDTG